MSLHVFTGAVLPICIDNLCHICYNFIAPPIKPCQKMPLKIKFIKDDDERILPYCEEEEAEKF